MVIMIMEEVIEQELAAAGDCSTHSISGSTLTACKGLSLGLELGVTGEASGANDHCHALRKIIRFPREQCASKSATQVDLTAVGTGHFTTEESQYTSSTGLRYSRVPRIYTCILLLHSGTSV